MRTSSYPVLPLLLNRWSPRSMTGEPINEETLMTLFEAARWAPSSYNNQPWRFLYAHRDTPEWDLFFNLLIDFNKQWTKNAAVLVCVVSYQLFDHNKKPSRTHSFDCGAAWMNLALQASHLGLVAHGMEGFDYDKARTVLTVPSDYTIECIVAIGKRAPKEALPSELQKREEPNERKPLKDIVFKGSFPGLRGLR